MQIDASGFAGVKQLDIYVEVSDGTLFSLASTTMTPDATDFAGFFPLSGQIVSGTTNQVRVGTALLDLTGTAPGANGDVSFSINLRTSATFTTATEATISIARISLGPTSSDRDNFTADVLNLVTTLNPPAPPVTEPAFSAVTATDVSVDFSPVGDGAASDGSDGEVALTVQFADASGAAATGQSISWTVSNSGAERVYVLAPTATTVGAGQQATISAATTNGLASLVLDSEGDKSAGSTSASVTASTSAANSEGTSRDLSLSFTVTWDVPVPAELASFAADVAVDGQVVLRWAVASQTNNLGWEVYRSTDNQVFARVSPLIPGEGTTDVFRTYEFADADLPVGDVVYYYLRQLDLDGSATRSDAIEVALVPTAVLEEALPTVTALLQNYPNPFNPETTIRFDLAAESSLGLRIYDATGQVVRSLVEGSLPAGSYSLLWDGTDESGERVGSGVFFYQLQTGSFLSMRKMTLIQ